VITFEAAAMGWNRRAAQHNFLHSLQISHFPEVPTRQEAQKFNPTGRNHASLPLIIPFQQRVPDGL